MKLNLTQKNTDAVFISSLDLLAAFQHVNEIWQDNQINHSLELTSDIAIDHISKFKSKYQRNKYFKLTKYYVKPVEKAIGTRWELRKVKKPDGRIVRIPRLIQCTMQYVSIIDTLKSLFLREEFTDIYFEYNRTLRSDTIGHDGSKSYTCFNSGNVYKKTEFFALNPNSLQIQIAYDDFDVCNPLQSKANRHKICSVYFSIHNLPPKYQSKLKNIYLVCLCNSDDLKSKQTDPNKVWRLIYDEISTLEVKGITACNNVKIKGTLIAAISDNLGVHAGQGYVASFSAHKCCRFCLCSREELHIITHESNCNLRTIGNYEESLELIAESVHVDYNSSNGVKFYCVLSDLQYFHIVENATADIMHDINEGCITKFLWRFFKFCFKKRIFSKDDFDDSTKFYHYYGSLNKSNIPSCVDFEKRNIGQNASQSMCLFRHLPFILYKYRSHFELKEVWTCYEALLYVCSVVYSYEITELELLKLEKSIKLHLELFKKIFQSNLSPKQHYLVHYPRIIREMGPLIYTSMMRFDSKHRVFKEFRHATYNFKAINQTLARQHQNQMVLNNFSYNDDIEWGVLSQLELNCLTNLISSEKLALIQPPLQETQFLHFNNYKYKERIMVVCDKRFHEICRIIYACQEFYFVCKPYVTLEFDTFLNSFHVKKEDTTAYSLIKFNDLQHFKSYELKPVQNKTYIMSDTRDLHKYINI